jgi:hypothetical protein
MKTILSITFLGLGLLFLAIYFEQKRNPYQLGSHLDYSIECENGFVYKYRNHYGAIQVLNSDGTPLKCGREIY